MVITTSDVRRDLARLIERGYLDRTEIEIMSKGGWAVLMSKASTTPWWKPATCSVRPLMPTA